MPSPFRAAFVGTAGVELVAQRPIHRPSLSTIYECEITRTLAGAHLRAALTYQKLSNDPAETRVGSIVGPDLSQSAMDHVQRKFTAQVSWISTAARTPVAMSVPVAVAEHLQDDRAIFRTRTVLDRRATFMQLAELTSNADWLMIGSMTPAEFGVVQRLLAKRTGATYLKINATQVADAKQTIELMTNATLSQISAPQLSALTGQQDLKSAMDRLIAAGVAGLIVTVGKNGLHAYFRGEHHQIPSYRVPIVRRSGAGDTFAGAMIAALERDEPFDFALAFASAAAGMHVGGADIENWDRMLHFAERTPKRYQVFRQKETSTVQLVRYLLPVGSAAIATIGLILMLHAIH